MRIRRNILRVLARPARIERGRDGLVIQAYRGYGSRREVFAMGRVLRQPLFGSGARKNAGNRDLTDLLRRFLRRGVGGAVVEARFVSGYERVTTDRDGYFRVHLRSPEPPPNEALWQPLRLAVMEPAGSSVEAEVDIFVPPATARFVVVSDIDDTVMYTGVANKLKMLWRLFVAGAKSRVAFPGVAAFYTALHKGCSGTEANPMLYVSRGPWSLYEVLDTFFNHHGIPIGPILFMREWGLTLQRPMPRRAKDHKLDLIRSMLSLYRELPFVLIGDSGQHDPEVYAQIVRENPGRVLAVYIRNVSRKPEREHAIEALAQEVLDEGSSLLLASDSFAMAEHAAHHRLLSREALDAVLAEKRDQEDPRQGRCGRHTKQVVEVDDLKTSFQEEPDTARPPNVAVEPGQNRQNGANRGNP